MASSVREELQIQKVALQLKCKCGFSFFKTKISTGDRTARFICVMRCPRCKRLKRRVVTITEHDARAMRAVNNYGFGETVLDNNPKDVYKRHMIFWKAWSVPFNKRQKLLCLLGCSRVNVHKLDASYPIKRYILLDAPTFCNKEVLLVGDIYTDDKETITEACRFCNLDCRKTGITCKMIKVSTRPNTQKYEGVVYRYLQDGRTPNTPL